MRTPISAYAGLVRLFKRNQTPPPPADPQHCDVPTLRGAEIAAVYYNQRVAGDFYEVLRVSPSRVLFGLLDVAGHARKNFQQAVVSSARDLCLGVLQAAQHFTCVPPAHNDVTTLALVRMSSHA